MQEEDCPYDVINHSQHLDLLIEDVNVLPLCVVQTINLFVITQFDFLQLQSKVWRL